MNPVYILVGLFFAALLAIVWVPAFWLQLGLSAIILILAAAVLSNAREGEDV